MKKTIKTIGIILAFLVVVYFGVFVAWAVLMTSCLDYEVMNEGDYCGQDELTLLIRKTHGFLVPFLE
jgi:mannitol-specific phosphotransferase system IIBC component